MEVRLLMSALRDLQQLDRNVAGRVVQRLGRFVSNFQQIQPERLTGDMSHYYKFRVGDYRLLYELSPENDAIIVHRIQHRREVYL